MSRFLHTMLRVGDLQRSVDFYTKAFGMKELRRRDVPVYTLSNWSSETFPAAQRRFEFLNWFDGMLLSGKVRLVKPDPRIFQLFLETHKVDPVQAAYIDDLSKNVDAAAAAGMHGIRFTNPKALRTELVSVGLLPK